MSHRAKRITNAIQTHDRELYAKHDGKAIRIYRKCKELRREMLKADVSVWNVVRNDHLVMSITDTWGVTGKPVDWGIEPIMARLRALDLWNESNLADKFFKDEEKLEKSKDREFKNTVESFLYDFKSQFQAATKDINTANMSKKITRNKEF